MLVTRDKKFYKLLLGISIPIGIQNLITFAVGMIDTLMLGSLGETELSAAAIGNNLFFILMLLMFGLAGGSNVMISQYWGKKDKNSIHKILSIMYRVCFVITFIFIGIAIFLPKQFMSIFTTDIAVINAGTSYLRIVAFGYLFYTLTNCTIMILRSIKIVRISLIVYGCSLIVNAFFNWIFIFGNLGFPTLGIKGAALATVIARITEFTIIIVFMIFIEDKLLLRLKHLISIDRLMLKDFISNVIPVLFNELLWSMGASMISIVVGRLGTEVVAANSINGVAHQFVTVFIFGLSNASAVIIGNSIGEGKFDKAKDYAKTIGIFSILMGIIAGIIIYFIRPIIVDFYNVSQTTKNFAMDIMSVTAIVVIFQSLGVNMMMGVLRGGGDSKFVLINDLIFMWLIAIPCGFFAAFVLELPVVLVFFIIKCDEILKSIISIVRVSSGKWIKDVTRDFDTLSV